MSKVGKVMKKEFLDNLLGPKCGEVDIFQKLGLVLGLELRLAIQVVKMATLDGPDGVQGWESDEKKNFWTTFCSQSVEKVDFLQKLGLALG